LRERIAALETQLAQRTAELDRVRWSEEHRFGELVLKRWKLHGIVRFIEHSWNSWCHHWVIWRLRLERLLPRRRRFRAMASICGNFPIYSQTFVYQELLQLQEHGFELRHAYSFGKARAELHQRFAGLWRPRRRLIHDYEQHRKDFSSYRRRMPAKVERLIDLLTEASGLPRETLIRHHDFLRGFSFTRMVEAWRPDWLHSYFFYERSLYALIAGFLLDIPRGITSYADHLLKDYELKVVPLQLTLSDVVVATSERIKRELLTLAPNIDADKILVKPNAIDCRHFPVAERSEPGEQAPWQLVSVCRIEPKKGLLHLAEAVRILRDERGRRVELHVIGEADKGVPVSEEYFRQLSAYCEQHRLGGTIHLEGRRMQADIARFLANAQIYVAPFVETETGDKDGIPTSLLEAMATGIAVVATDAGSMAEVITPDLDGVIVAQRRATALADAIDTLLSSPERRRQLGRAAAARVRTHFDVSVCEARLHARIDAVIAAKRRA
jgi:glycosyltransferase involved in cell wall biosynthesis